VSTNGIMDTSLRVRRRHRSWPEALKREIVAASLVPGASVSVIARQYDVNANQVFTWRKRFGETPNAAPAPQLVPVLVTPDQPAAGAAAALCDVIEIDLPRGYRLRIGGGVKATALRVVLDALERR
jgi:transposase